MIVTVTLNPAVDKTVTITDFAVDRVNRVESMRLDAGGKGINVSKTIANIGGQSVAMGILGGETGMYIQKSLDAAQIKSDFTFSDVPTRTNLKVVDSKNNTNTDINETGGIIPDAVLHNVHSKLMDLIKPDDIVVLSGKAPAGCAIDTIVAWIAQYRSKGARVFLDAEGELLTSGLKQLPYLAKPNQNELENAVGRSLNTIDELVDAGRHIIESGVEFLVISMGSEGALFINRHIVLRATSPSVGVISTVGAGDAVMAALAYGIHSGMDWVDIAKLSMASGAAKVACSGTQAPDGKEIHKLVDHVILTKLWEEQRQ